jgi:hypothetical protein
MKDDFPTPPTWCPNCLHPLDRAGSLRLGTAPRPGDYSVCINCAIILTFGPQLQALVPDPILMSHEMAEDPDLYDQLALIVAAVRQVHQQLGKPDDDPRSHNA